jgi:cyclophilin family peptidyl-prolyl cis-trans isomerase
MKKRLFACAFSFLALGATALPAAAEEYVCFDTNYGDICFDLFPEAAPLTVANFLRYVDRGAYTNVLFHRSVKSGIFVIQGGGFSGAPDPNQFSRAIATDPPIANESGVSNLRGTIAMARTSDPNSATNQWFINVQDNTGLNGTRTTGYAVFGEVVHGMDVVDRISALRIGDFSVALNSAAFSEMPVDMAPGESNADFTDFVIIERAYRTDRLPGLLPYQCSLTSPGDTLTEFCGSTVTFPVLVSGVLYEGTLQYIPGRTALEFSVDRSKLKVLSDTGQPRATFNAGVLTIPSVRNGAKAFDNVTLDMISREPLEFRVRTFTPR